jgi:hypothetical protein
MNGTEAMERELRRQLIPRGMSREGIESLEAMIDELAAESSPRPPRARRWVAAAACVVAAVAGWWAVGPGETPATAVADGVGETGAAAGEIADDDGVRLVSESRGVISAAPDGPMIAGEDGSLVEAWHVRVLDEECFHDPETGHDVRVTRPRDEWVLMPVNSF